MTQQVEERKQTLSERLKERASTIVKKELEELCIILVDVSSSMESYCENNETKLTVVKRSIPVLHAAGSYVEYGLVAFGSQAYLIQGRTTSFQNILIQSDLLQAVGQTNIPSALKLGMEMMEDTSATKKRMILMSDGDNNCEREKMDGRIEECKKMEIIIDSIGFGKDANETLLREIAKRTGGVYQKADSPLALRKAYEKLNFRVRYIEWKNGGEKNETT